MAQGSEQFGLLVNEIPEDQRIEPPARDREDNHGRNDRPPSNKSKSQDDDQMRSSDQSDSMSLESIKS